MAIYITWGYDNSGNCLFNIRDCVECKLRDGDKLYLGWQESEKYDNYVKQHKKCPSLLWAIENFNCEEFKWEEGFEPWNLSEVVAIATNGDQAYHVGDADDEINIALEATLYGYMDFTEGGSFDNEFLSMAKRLDFDDVLPDRIYKTANYIFAFL